MRRLVAAVLILVAGGLAPTTASAQRDPGRISVEECQRSVAIEARRKYDADRAQFLGAARLRQVSNAQNGVSGKGQLDTSRGWVPFSYSCIHNIRTGKTGGIDIKVAGSISNKDAGKVAGAIVGAAIAGAIIGAMDKDGHRNDASDRGWWSPENGIQCNSYQSACYKNGRFAARWTKRIYGR